MPFIRKKESLIKKLLSTQSFVFVIMLIGVIFFMGCPERLALHFFIILESFNISRITISLVWILFFFIIFILITIITIKEIRWNNKNLNLPVIDYDCTLIKINNYKNQISILIDDISKISIMNKDSVLKIGCKNNKSYIPEYLESNRKTYEALENYLKQINNIIIFEDTTNLK